MERSKDIVSHELEVYNSQVDIYTLPIYTRSQLRKYNGTEKSKLFVAIEGYIYDVTANTRNYGPGKSYHKLVGKDVSRLLGLNKLQLKPSADDNIFETKEEWDTSDFSDKEYKALEKWTLFFKKRYKIVGLVIDHQMRR